jgi:Skp family chaperone for outer membrane proteins
MKTFLNTAAALALATVVAAPASAQVNGIGVADPAIVVASAKALHDAYGQISTTYQAQRTQLQQLDQQRATLIKQFDTNNDGQLSQAEQTAAQTENNPTRKQLETLDKQIAQVQVPINIARAYVVDQVAQQLNAAVQQVVSQGKVQMILAPSQVLYMADAADLTKQIVAALDQRLPQVSITPPAGWQPTQQSAELFNDVQQVLVAAAVQQQQQQQQAAARPQQQPAAKAPATPTKGR